MRRLHVKAKGKRQKSRCKSGREYLSAQFATRNSLRLYPEIRVPLSPRLAGEEDQVFGGVVVGIAVEVAVDGVDGETGHLQ